VAQTYDLGKYEFNENEAVAMRMIVRDGGSLQVVVDEQVPIVVLSNGSDELRFPLEGKREDIAVGYRPGRKKRGESKAAAKRDNDESEEKGNGESA
jgi:hypothetical protein